MKQALTLSIVIPVYNEEHHIKACLDSIAAQTVKPDEVIVVDNNSTDQTTTIAKGYPFVKIVSESKQGIVFARDAGFDAARSEIIGRIDADTVLPPDWVARVMQFYAQPTRANQALTGGCFFYNIRLPRFNHWITSQFVFRVNRWLVGHYILWGSNMALPRSLWQAVRAGTCRRTDIHEDLDLAIHLHRLGYAISYQAGLIVGARLNRLYDNHDKLWGTLMLWPRTLRVHHLPLWVFGWLGSVFLYVMQPVPLAAEGLARLVGRPKSGS